LLKFTAESAHLHALSTGHAHDVDRIFKPRINEKPLEIQQIPLHRRVHARNMSLPEKYSLHHAHFRL
jgi:hypothetical protein